MYMLVFCQWPCLIEPAQKSFNDLLTAYRSELLPTVVDNWGELIIEQKEAMYRMHNFFCGMDFIVGVADQFSTFWNSPEVKTTTASTAEPTEVGCIGSLVIRTVCNLFEKWGDQNSDTPCNFHYF